jgi:hypothetical protein
MDLKTLTNMFPSHKLVMGEQFAQENISALRIKSVLNWSDTIFVNCDFTESQFHLLMISSAIFFKCDFSGATFRACDIESSEFITCNLTCADLLGSAVNDTTFTDCIIGGLVGPVNHEDLSFYFPRYSRHLPLTSQAPYYVFTLPGELVYIFRTEESWRLHSEKRRISVMHGDIDTIAEPYRTLLNTALELDRQKLEAMLSCPVSVA